MVTIKLLNIDNDKGVVYYHCMPEGREEGSFNLGLDPYNKKIVSNSLGKRNSYVVHAAYKIYDFYAENGKVPQEIISVWH